MKKSVMLVLIISILLVSVISVSLVSAGLLGDIWNRITGRVTENETEATNETETEPEPEPEPPLEKQCEEGKTRNHVCEDGTEVSWCDCENNMWVCKISPENECPEEEEPEICAAKIEINFDKTGYAPGDPFKVEVGIFDSQGNPIPNYLFYAKMYDNMWHSPDLQRTGADGYFRDSGNTPQKALPGVTKGIFNVYTKETSSCRSVEDTIELRLEEPEPVPCGIGKCVPEPECEDKVRMCGGACPPCPKNKTKGEIFYACSGCELGDKCYPMGYRKEGQYCSENYEFVSQLEADSFCENSFECKTNLCIDGECMSSGLWKKILNFFKRIFGSGPEPPEPPQIVECSKLLIEKNIGDYEYFISEYGKREEHQVGLFSEDGEQIGIVKCCVAGYKNPDGTEGKAGIVCPFDNKEDVENSIYGLLNNGDIVLGEYKGQKVYRRFDKPEEIPEIIVWTSNLYLIASGVGPGEGELSEEVADAYLNKYPNDL